MASENGPITVTDDAHVSTTTLDERGRVTVPEAIRERLGLRAGDELEFFESEGTTIVRKRPAESPFAAWRGFLRHLEGTDPDELISEMRGR